MSEGKEESAKLTALRLALAAYDAASPFASEEYPVVLKAARHAGYNAERAVIDWARYQLAVADSKRPAQAEPTP